MATQNLSDIRAFPELVRYLEEELDWPLQEYGFDDLTFEYQPAELGLKEEDAARIKTIHQLRPLASGQPWGIFFVEFENKKLPVVVLRRILSHLALKKRASANKASAPAWHAEDLLFITAFGEDETDAREIAFAHFHQNPGDMPTLHVLGWDGGDTPLKLANVDHVLRERLRWPDDEKDTQAWRETWSKPFRHRIGHVITTASLLAEELACLARGIRDKAKLLLAAESEKGEITKLYKAFQTALIHDLTPESFADTYAQTITYGLLTAAISRTDTSEGRYGTFVKADDIADMVPITNPFLKEMLQTFLKVGGRKGGIDFDELGIQDVVELLRGDETDLPAILRDFGNKTRGEDPVIHFYEHFLSAYNKKLKIQRGVFYTPQPVVSYIVRSVHELLQTEFGLEDGLASTITWGEMAARQIPLSPPFSKGGAIVPHAEEGENNKTESSPPLKRGGEGGFKIPEGTSPDEPFVVILDPATGTATFLVEVINVVHRTLMEKWKKSGASSMPLLPRPLAGEGGGEGVFQIFQDYWNEYVPRALLPRLYGYELMMAPYAIAHMKIGIKLAETGYRFLSNERVRIYLTNALEPWQRQLKVPDFEALAHEAVAVNEVKRDKRFTVIVGNPPYSVSSQNDGKWIVDLCDDFKNGLKQERNIQPLSDDYVKFLRLALFCVEQSEVGLIGMITSREYIQGVIHRSIRSKFLGSSTTIAIFDLHGQRGELFASSVVDENVFDIEKGVAISIISRAESKKKNVVYGDVVGKRSEKIALLSGSIFSATCTTHLEPSSPYWFLKPWNINFKDEYFSCPSILDFLTKKPVTGFATHRDHFAVGFSKEELVQNLERFLDVSLSDNEIATEFDLGDTRDWQLHRARISARRDKAIFESIRQCTYRPFDDRWVIYSDDILEYSRRDAMQHVSKNTPALICSRIVKDETFAHVFISRYPIEKIFLSPKSSNNAQVCLTGSKTIDESSWFSVGVGIVVPKTVSLPSGAETSEIIHYAYAVFHSPCYRTRYAEFLKIDFPRLPLTGDLELFRALAKLGGELVALHLLESPKLDQPITEFIGGENPEVEKPSWSENTVWVDKAQTTGFKGVREEVWNFHIGGYQVCQKWLKDRKGRTLTQDDLAHYQKIVIVLSETIRLMAEIDKVIEQHGGWPGAFQVSADKADA